MVMEPEYSASQIRRILQQLFPHRRLVLSQFTFFNHIGVAKATGETLRRGRRCYRLQDVLSIACVLTLKEEGIPYKNVEALPTLVQENADRIFQAGAGTRLSGFGHGITLTMPGEPWQHSALSAFLDDTTSPTLFWSFDVGELANQLKAIVRGEYEQLRKAA